MDVKCARALLAIPRRWRATWLKSLLAVANQAGLPTVALITDIGPRARPQCRQRRRSSKPSVPEGRGHARSAPARVTMALAARWWRWAASHPMPSPAGQGRAALADGRAAEVFAAGRGAGRARRFSRAQRALSGARVGDPPFNAERSGHGAGMDAAVGIAVVALGRRPFHADDAIDPRFGLTDVIDVGHGPGRQPVGVVHAASGKPTRPGDRDPAAGRRIEDGARPNGRRSSIGRPMKLDRAAYDRDGFLVLKDFLSAADCDALQGASAHGRLLQPLHGALRAGLRVHRSAESRRSGFRCSARAALSGAEGADAPHRRRRRPQRSKRASS